MEAELQTQIITLNRGMDASKVLANQSNNSYEYLWISGCNEALVWALAVIMGTIIGSIIYCLCLKSSVVTIDCR